MDKTFTEQDGILVGIIEGKHKKQTCPFAHNISWCGINCPHYNSDSQGYSTCKGSRLWNGDARNQ